MIAMSTACQSASPFRSGSGAAAASVLGGGAAELVVGSPAVAARPTASATERMGCGPDSARSEPDSSAPSGVNAIASPCGSSGSGTRTGVPSNAATRSPSGTVNR